MLVVVPGSLKFGTTVVVVVGAYVRSAEAVPVTGCAAAVMKMSKVNVSVALELEFSTSQTAVALPPLTESSTYGNPTGMFPVVAVPSWAVAAIAGQLSGAASEPACSSAANDPVALFPAAGWNVPLKK